ncbi:MAG: hypothetical protein ACE5J2_00635 [Nitrososphaerales archaeon]
MSNYSWREFGREAEFVVASYLRSKDWNIRFSPSSRGAADIIADKDGRVWCIQVKASTKSPHIKSEEITRLKMYAYSINGLPVSASVQPWQSDGKQRGASIGEYMIFLYSAENWELLQP